MRFLSEFSRAAAARHGDAMQLLRDTLDAEFLFDREAVAFIDEIYRKSNECSDAATMLNELPEGNRRRAELQLQLLELEKWMMITAFDEAKKQFKPYLQLYDGSIRA